MRGGLVAFLVFLAACPGKDPEPVDSDTEPPADIDGDGFTVEEGDCDDARAGVHPGATDEPYDGIDSDCAGDSDNDADGDGADSSDHGGTDCDDANAAVGPTAVEVCDDANLDEDCDGDADDEDTSVTGTTRGGIDGDGDGYAALSGQADTCDHPANGGDCDDAAASVHPGATEVCNSVDDDCDTVVDSPNPTDGTLWYVDADGDGFGIAAGAIVACTQPANTSAVATDCDDDAAAAYPAAPSVACDGLDNDCDATTVESGAGAVIGTTPYATVRAAVLAAVTDDVVRVCEGRHSVNDVVIVSGIELVGIGGRASTILDAEDSGTVLRVLSDDPVVIRGLTLTGGAGFDEGSVTNGGAMWIDVNADVTLEDALVTGSTAGDGAGIYVGEDSTVRLVRTLVVDNHGNDGSTPVPFGGGVFMDDRSTLELEESEIADNTSGVGAGIAMEADTTILGDHASAVRTNESDLAGAGISAERGGSSISGIEVVGNSTGNASAGIRGTDLTLTDVLVQGNDAGLSGGGFSGSGDLVFTRVTFDANYAGIDAGAIDVYFDGSTLTLDACAITGNTATFFAAAAGGVKIAGGTLVSTQTDWGTALNDNPPGDLAFTEDDFVCNYVGLQTFTYNDGSNVRICP